MDCSICMEAITKQTGIVTLSCEHSFHFRCIDEWFYRQLVQTDHQTCPCCRSAGTGLDRGAYDVEEESDDESEETESEYTEEDDDDDEDHLISLLMEEDLVMERNVTTGQILFTPALEISLMRVRNLFGPLNDLDIEEPSENIAAKKIQAIYRGYKARTAFESHKAATSLIRLFYQDYIV